MKKLAIILTLLSFVTPVHARMIMQQDPIESDLVTQPQDRAADQKKKQLEEDMSRDYKQPVIKGPEKAQAQSGSNWWKWTLGAAVVGGVAVAAAGGGHKGGSSSDSGATGNIGASW